MKHFLLLLLFALMKTGLAQSTSADSLKKANVEFDNKILSMIKTYEQEGYDFLVFRVYDTLWPFENRCRFMIRKDSCTQRFGLSMDRDYSIHHVTISYIDYYDENSPCHDDIAQIEADWFGDENYFRDQGPDSLNFEISPYTLYGRVNGKYLYEIFGKEFVSKFHSGMLYEIVCSYMGGRCER